MKTLKTTIAATLAAITLTATHARASNANTAAGRIPASFNVGQIYAGLHLGVGVPLAIGCNDDPKFNDVARSGFAVVGDGMWMPTENIGLGAQIGFQNFPYNEEYWGNLGWRGTFDASFHSLNFGLTGRIFLTKNQLRPFLGIAAGGEMVKNSLSFTHQTNPDVNFSYDTANLSPAFGLMTGMYYKVAKRAMVSINIRLNIIPLLEKETHSTYDNQTHQQGDPVVYNAHGKQNNLLITVGLHIGTNKNLK